MEEQEKCPCGRDLADCECQRKPIYTEEELRNILIRQVTQMAMWLNYDTTTLEDMRERLCDEAVQVYAPVPERMKRDMDRIIELSEEFMSHRSDRLPIYPYWLAKMIEARTQQSAN